MMKMSLSNAWLRRDLGFLFWAVDTKQMQEVAGERGGYLHGRGALDSDDLLYLKEQMEAEADAECLLRHTEKRAFAAFKRAASMADASPAATPLVLRVEPKPKSGIRQKVLLKKVVEVKPKRQKVSNPPADGNTSITTASPDNIVASTNNNHLKASTQRKDETRVTKSEAVDATKVDNPAKTLLGLAYESSDSED